MNGPYGQGGIVDNDLVESCLDQATCKMLELLARLNEKIVSWWDLDRDAFASVTSPDVQSGVTGAAVDGEEVEIRMEPCKNCIFLAILDKIGCGWSKKVGSRKEIFRWAQ